jgi:hypothetical protein
VAVPAINFAASRRVIMFLIPIRHAAMADVQEMRGPGKPVIHMLLDRCFPHFHRFKKMADSEEA